MDKQKTSIEQARAYFRGNEFGEYENPAPARGQESSGFGRFLWRLVRLCGYTAARPQ